MFHVQECVPDVYIQESRDFQLLSRLADLIINSSRFSINSMEDLTSSRYCNDRVLELTKTKIGFFNNRDVDEQALRSILCAYPHIMRCKGTLSAINMVLTLFKRLSLNSITDTSIDNEKREVKVVLRKTIIYTDILKDLLQELLPTGYSLVFTIQINTRLSSDVVSLSDRLNVYTTNVPDSSNAPSKDNIMIEPVEDYNIVTNVSNTSKFGSRVSTSQIVSLDQYSKIYQTDQEE